VKKSDEAWAARKVERGDGRACNPETEFRLGFAAGTVDPFRWRGLYAIAAKRAAQYELVLREAGLPVRDALVRDVFSAEDVAAAKVAALDEFEGYITNTVDAPDARQAVFYMIAEHREQVTQ